MIIKKLFTALLLIVSPLTALEEEESIENIYYGKIGAAIPVGEFIPLPFPTFSIGIRGHFNEFKGWDLSANVSSLILVNYASIKGFFLNYPYGNSCPLYLGLGPGFGYYSSDFVLGGLPILGGGGSETTLLALEAVLGYEFRNFRYLKYFIQLELTQPLINLGNANIDFKPGIALVWGFGF